MSKAKPHEIKNIKQLRSHLGECTVLLKKDGSFPLEKPGTIAAYGSGVRHTLFMPGSKKDYEELVQGIKDGIVSREQLKWNAHWLLETLKITHG